MIKYNIINDKKIEFIINDDVKKITINKFIRKVNNIFESYCYDERIINNDSEDITYYYDTEDLINLLDYNHGLYNISDNYILYRCIDELTSYDIYSLIYELIETYDRIVLEALGYDF